MPDRPSAPAAARRSLTVRQLGLAAGVGLALLSLAAWGLRSLQGPLVNAIHPATQDLTQTLLVTGRVVWPGRTELGVTAQGTVAAVLIDEGATVEADALLVQLDPRPARSRLQEAEARVAGAQARWRRLRGPGRSVAEAQAEQARVAAADAARTLSRQETLFAAGDIAEAELDAARLQRDTTQSQLRAAEQEAAASARGGADTAAAYAALAEARAGLAQAELALAQTEVRAPTAGRVLERRVEPGQLVRPGDVVVVVSGAAPLAVEITPDEVHLGRLVEGQAAEVALQAFPDRPLPATLTALAPQVDPARGTVRADLHFDAPAPAWVRPDMTATVEVVLGAAQDALVLPVERVADRERARPWVLVAEDGVAVRREVALGLEGDAVVQVTEGLDRDALVLSPHTGLRPGQSVRAAVSAED